MQVWAEVRLGGSWVHCDPCEAAVDEPLIYQGWGKNQTLILSFTFDDVEVRSDTVVVFSCS